MRSSFRVVVGCLQAKNVLDGVISMANALAWSKNCATAYIMKQVGPQQFADFLARLNIPTKVEPYPSIALGSCDLSLFEMLWGYTIFAGRGFSTKPYFISRIEDRNGNVIKRFDYSVNRKEAVSEITAYRMARMMQGPVDKGTAAGLREAWELWKWAEKQAQPMTMPMPGLLAIPHNY